MKRKLLTKDLFAIKGELTNARDLLFKRVKLKLDRGAVALIELPAHALHHKLTHPLQELCRLMISAVGGLSERGAVLCVLDRFTQATRLSPHPLADAQPRRVIARPLYTQP